MEQTAVGGGGGAGLCVLLEGKRADMGYEGNRGGRQHWDDRYETSPWTARDNRQSRCFRDRKNPWTAEMGMGWVENTEQQVT